MKILLVEDDVMIGEGVRTGLRMEGCTVDWVRDARLAEAALGNGGYSLMLLDLGLPRKDGLALLKELRDRGEAIPVLILTARDALADRVAGLNAGADDDLVKPFHFEELMARVQALLRRQGGRAQPAIRIGPLSLDPVGQRVSLRGQGVALSPLSCIGSELEGRAPTSLQPVPEAGLPVELAPMAERKRIGLGLSIVRRVAERHQAEIERGEGGAGRGLRVAVRLRAALSAGQR